MFDVGTPEAVASGALALQWGGLFEGASDVRGEVVVVVLRQASEPAPAEPWVPAEAPGVAVCPAPAAPLAQAPVVDMLFVPVVPEAFEPCAPAEDAPERDFVPLRELVVSWPGWVVEAGL